MIIPLVEIDYEASLNPSRVNLRPEDCHGLAKSMAKLGQLVPIRVRKSENGKWIITYGFRRYLSACILGWAGIEAIEETGDKENDPIKNLVENLQRENLSFWEECVGIKRAFPETTSHQDVADMLGYSRPWASLRRRVWSLNDEALALVQSGQLGPADVLAMIGHSEEEQLATVAMVKDAEKKGEEKPKITIRQHPRSVKQLRRMQTILFDSNREDWNILLKYALGEVDDETVLRELDIREIV